MRSALDTRTSREELINLEITFSKGVLSGSEARSMAPIFSERKRRFAKQPSPDFHDLQDGRNPVNLVNPVILFKQSGIESGRFR